LFVLLNGTLLVGVCWQRVRTRFKKVGRVCSREWGVSHREESNSNEERVNELNKALLYF